MHISQKMEDARAAGKVSISFEFYPPKTSQGLYNLYDRMERMHSFGPSFIDITWGAGGHNNNLTSDMVTTSQTALGLETCMHLTCTNMPKSKLDLALEKAYKAGCTNILALRGDKPKDKESWETPSGGFEFAKDLVKYIHEKYDNHFDIGVAGYPEGCEDNKDQDLLIQHLKEKVDAGATFIITQMFYDIDLFTTWLSKCRAAGITVPIIPGIMPISTYNSFERRYKWTECHVPSSWFELLDPICNDDFEVRAMGTHLLVELCKSLLALGINHLHFYTMNLAQATEMILDGLGLLPASECVTPTKSLPWRPSLGFNRTQENVRPIFWRNRNKSYIARTRDWDEFPNGRWGDARSPAFANPDVYGAGLHGTQEHLRKLWGAPRSIKEISSLFGNYLQGKLSCLPWSESAVTSEIDVIKDSLVSLNERGFLTINSQAAVNGARSSDSVYGWGPRNGFVYQKSYLEVLVSPELMSELVTRLDRDEGLIYYCINNIGELTTNAISDHPNAVTWGIFPGKEIIQPTIVERISFLAWKDEFYRLGFDWSQCYLSTEPTRYLIEDIMNTWYLINIVHNDFHQSDAIFKLFEGLVVPDYDTITHEVEDIPIKLARVEDKVNGVTVTDAVNGINGTHKTDMSGINADTYSTAIGNSHTPSTAKGDVTATTVATPTSQT